MFANLTNFCFIFILSYSYLLADKNESLSSMKNNPKRRSVSLNPDSFTTHSPKYKADYNKYMQPEKPKLTFGFHIEKMRTVSEIEKIFSFDAIVTAKWNDPRLRDYLSISQESWTYSSELEFKADFLENIWQPDLVFDPLVSVEESKASSKVFLGRNGEVHVSKFGRYTFSYEMDLLFFPFDQHKCAILIGVYKIDVDIDAMIKNIEQQFSMKPDQIIGNLRFNDLDYARDFRSHSAGNENLTYYMEHALVLRMIRNPLFYVLTLFVPNMVLTVLSWAVLWIEPSDLPERANICIALIMAQIILITSEDQSFPQSTEFKIIDGYLIMNFLLNVASLVETLVASFAMKRIIRKKNQDSIQLKTFGHNELNAASGAKPEEETSADFFGSSNGEFPSNPQISKDITKAVVEQKSDLISIMDGPDRISRIAFPISFVAWNCLFFTLSKYFADKTFNESDPQPNIS